MQQPISDAGGVARAGFPAPRDLWVDTPLQPFGPILNKWFSEDLHRVCAPMHAMDRIVFDDVLEQLAIRYRCAPQDLRRIPAAGPVIVVANHAFGLADPLILGAMLAGVREDVCFLANSFLESIPQLAHHVIPVNPFGGPAAVRENRKSLRRSIEWLSAGGLLVVFPAGEVASMQPPDLGIRDPQWTENVARLMLRTGASAVPVFFHGTNSLMFHLAGLLHPSLRTMLLPRELLNKAGTEIPVSVGKPIRADRLLRMPGFRDATDYLRARTYLLEGRSHLASSKPFPNPGMWRKPAALAPAQDPADMEREIAGQPIERHLVVASEYEVCMATAQQIPATLLEIGRLREVTFRAVGEGTGNSRDLDVFDRHYEHLLVWNRERREVAGAYRLARTDEILKNMGSRGLYTSTLFHLHPNFYGAVGPAIELGRSFVRAEYQKNYLPLLLLWKGLGHYVAANPQYRILFGPVSISKNYTPSSRTVMAEYLKSQSGSQNLAAYIKPRKPFRTHGLSGCDPRTFRTLVSNLEDLSELVADLEADHKGIPVLLQQYLNLGGQVLEFSVDQKFSNVLDGLIVVDLVKASPSKLERYMGKDNARNFLAHHAPPA